MSRDWFRIPRPSRGAWVIALVIIGLGMAGCSRDDRRALTDTEVRAELIKYNGTLLATTTMNTRTVLFMDSPTGKRCHISQIRDTGPVSGGHAVLKTVPISDPITILENWDAGNQEVWAVLCVALNDPALQRDAARVRLTLPDESMAEESVAGQPNFIISIPVDGFLHSYTFEVYDAKNNLIHTEQIR
jgi:hypothetical protein